jgi:hypothetical protein
MAQTTPSPVPHAAITFHPETKLYGFSVWMPGRRPHYCMDVFATPTDAKQWLDPWNDRIWEESGDGSTLVEVSRKYKPGSVPTRL